MILMMSRIPIFYQFSENKSADRISKCILAQQMLMAGGLGQALEEQFFSHKQTKGLENKKSFAQSMCQKVRLAMPADLHRFSIC